ncbi:helix-turn-helix domain-containing protein [Sphingobacterium tabacisoli]|uniref:Helix-turn-helix domain-containing protein n=1 Tax=Sphingobacterium tabacisoli TaxID=2044855 RepID=A0ABW5L5M0_9SPHI|nr:helix-turn-helix transcriptional regulator [Sphingobacterium tabacisoli]
MRRVTLSTIYAINKVKFWRLIKNISARELSVAIDKAPEYVSNVENMSNKNQYPHHVLIAIAKVLGCDVRDFYPSDEELLESDGSRFVKEIISLSNIDDCTLVINGMIDAGYFVDGKSADDTAKYLFEQGKPNALVIEEALRVVEKSSKLSLRNGKYISK